MRSLVHVVAMVGLIVPVAAVGGSAFAADLDHYYEPAPVPILPPPPPPVAVLPPPQVPLAVVPRPCVYGPCRGPYARFYPRPGYDYERPAYGYERPAYAPIDREGYGYDYDRERFERAHEHFTRYGYERPYQRRDDERRERVERYERGRPYADPLGHDRPDWRRNDRFGDEERRDDERRYDERFERRPGPYDRG